ncbi:MAG: type II secretion system F family protein [Rubrivivax sp.]|nr:type II secretion system F family protein [Hylemonella sp.]MDP2004224.1 type II secretion system F family protein [Rubrivivax sp.]
MAVFAWQGRNARGEQVKGSMDAVTEASVADQLLAINITPVHIEASSGVAGGARSTHHYLRSLWMRLSSQAVSSEDVELFSRQMYTLDKAGVPILRAFSGLEASATKPAMEEVLRDVRENLSQGRELSSSLAQHPSVFGAFYIAMIRVGEMSGKLTEVYSRLSDHLAFERDVRERIRQALRYPAFVLIAMSLALVLLNVFVLPVFAKVFSGFNAELPLLTRVLLGFSSWMQQWWLALLGGVLGGGLAWRAYLKTPNGRYRWDQRKLRLPLVGGIVLKATLARFARSFALSSQSGMPLVPALTVVAKTVDNAYIGSRIEQMRDGIERGTSIANCAANVGIFTPLVLQMISVGEETGELDSMLFEIAEMYEREVDHSIKGLSAAIEPILLAVISALMLVLALGIFMPLWNMGQAAMGRSGG